MFRGFILSLWFKWNFRLSWEILVAAAVDAALDAHLCPRATCLWALHGHGQVIGSEGHRDGAMLWPCPFLVADTWCLCALAASQAITAAAVREIPMPVAGQHRQLYLSSARYVPAEQGGTGFRSLQECSRKHPQVLNGKCYRKSRRQQRKPQNKAGC